VRKVIAEELRKKGFKVFQEMSVTSKKGSNRRCDIIAINKDKKEGYILDPTISFENKKHKLPKSIKKKEDLRANDRLL
jgi:hypothetical protein